MPTMMLLRSRPKGTLTSDVKVEGCGRAEAATNGPQEQNGNHDNSTSDMLSVKTAISDRVI